MCRKMAKNGDNFESILKKCFQSIFGKMNRFHQIWEKLCGGNIFPTQAKLLKDFTCAQLFTW